MVKKQESGRQERPHFRKRMRDNADRRTLVFDRAMNSNPSDKPRLRSRSVGVRGEG